MIDENKKAEFDFTDAIGQVFKTDGGKDFGIRLWFWLTACLSIVYLISIPMMSGGYVTLLDLNWENMQAFREGEVPSEDNSMAILKVFGSLITGYSVMIFGFWFSIVMAESALHRRNLLGAEHPKSPLRFGKTELNLLLCQLAVILILTLAYIVSIIALSVFGAAGAMVSSLLAGILIFLGVLAVLAFLMLLAMRLMPAGAMTVEKGSFVINSNKVTKGRFWSFFWVYVVIVLGSFIGSYLVMTIGSMLIVGDAEAVAAFMGSGTEAPSVVFSEVAAKMKNPVFVLLAVLTIIAYAAIQALVSLLLSGVGSYALRLYRQDNPV